jgi:hypothetical protein
MTSPYPDGGPSAARPPRELRPLTIISDEEEVSSTSNFYADGALPAVPPEPEPITAEEAAAAGYYPIWWRIGLFLVPGLHP